jgi:hypothetical protein
MHHLFSKLMIVTNLVAVLGFAADRVPVNTTETIIKATEKKPNILVIKCDEVYCCLYEEINLII